MIARSALAIAALLGLLAVAPTSEAHANGVVADGEHRIDAGGAVELDASVHFHRLVGEVRIADARPGDALVVRVRTPDGTFVAAEGASPLRVNALVACCHDATWTPIVVRIENAGPRPILAEASLVLLHDGFAVADRRAETGADVSLIVLLGAPALVALWPRRTARPAPRALRHAAYALAGAWLLAGAIAIPTMLVYGGGPIQALVAAAARLPWIPGPILTTQDVLTLALVALWAAALVRWGAACRAAPAARGPVLFAFALALTAIAGGLAWALSTPARVVPLLGMAAALAGPLAWMLPPVRRALATVPVGVDEARAKED